MAAVDSPEGMVPDAVQRPMGVTGAAIAVLDAEGAVAGWTQAAERLVGYSAAEVVGRPAAVILPSAEDRAKAYAFARRCRARNGWSGLAALRHHDGRRLDVSLQVSPLSGQDGRAGPPRFTQDHGVGLHVRGCMYSKTEPSGWRATILVPLGTSFGASSTSAPALLRASSTGSKEPTMTVAVCDTYFSSGPEYSRNGPTNANSTCRTPTAPDRQKPSPQALPPGPVRPSAPITITARPLPHPIRPAAAHPHTLASRSADSAPLKVSGRAARGQRDRVPPLPGRTV
jgi:PAS domain S-box-containing protein